MERPTKEVAKLVRNDIKVAIKSGALPKDIRISVKSRYRELYLKVDEAPYAVTIPASLEIQQKYGVKVVHSPELKAVEAFLEGLLDQYKDVFHCEIYHANS